MMKNKYGITELASLYFPDSRAKNARRRFFKVLRAERDLWDELEQLHFGSFQRNFTPKQYQRVIEVLGEPLLSLLLFQHIKDIPASAERHMKKSCFR